MGSPVGRRGRARTRNTCSRRAGPSNSRGGGLAGSPRVDERVVAWLSNLGTQATRPRSDVHHPVIGARDDIGQEACVVLPQQLEVLLRRNLVFGLRAGRRGSTHATVLGPALDRLAWGKKGSRILSPAAGVASGGTVRRDGGSSRRLLAVTTSRLTWRKTKPANIPPATKVTIKHGQDEVSGTTSSVVGCEANQAGQQGNTPRTVGDAPPLQRGPAKVTFSLPPGTCAH